MVWYVGRAALGRPRLGVPPLDFDAMLVAGAAAAAAHSRTTPYADVLPSDMAAAACAAMGITEGVPYVVVLTACAAASHQEAPRTFDEAAAIRGMAAGLCTIDSWG